MEEYILLISVFTEGAMSYTVLVNLDKHYFNPFMSNGTVYLINYQLLQMAQWLIPHW